MEAATAGGAPAAPAAADADGQVQTPQGQPAAPGAPEAAPQDDVQAQLAELQQRAEAAEQQLQQFQEGQPQDLLSALEGTGGDELGLSAEDIAALEAGDQGQVSPDQQQEQLSELEGWVQDLAQQMIDPLIEERQTERVEAWGKEHPDLKPGTPLFQEFIATMENLAGELGPAGQAAIRSPKLLDLAYTGAKAKLADAGAVPAEQAGAHGASLETGAGTVQTDGDSEADRYRKALTGAADNPLA